MAAISNGHQREEGGGIMCHGHYRLLWGWHRVTKPIIAGVSVLKNSEFPTLKYDHHLLSRFSSHWHRHECRHRWRGRGRSQARGCRGQPRRRRRRDQGGGVRGPDTGLGALLVSAAIPRGGDRGLRHLWSREQPGCDSLRWSPGQI